MNEDLVWERFKFHVIVNLVGPSGSSNCQHNPDNGGPERGPRSMLERSPARNPHPFRSARRGAARGAKQSSASQSAAPQRRADHNDARGVIRIHCSAELPLLH